MKVILDTIIGSVPLFICVIIFLVSTFVVLVRSITKQLNNHKIPIYGEDDAVADAEEKNIIEKPAVVKEDDSKEEEESSNSEDEVAKVDEKTETAEEQEAEKVEELIEEDAAVSEEEEIDEDDIPEAPKIDVEALDNISDKVIEARIDDEHRVDIEEELEKVESSELKSILTEMKEVKKIDPEEVVRNFENEQEAKSIISYQELVDVVKNRDNEFVDELEAEPLATVSDFIPESKPKSSKPNIEVLEVLEQLDSEKEMENLEVEELLAISDSDVEELATEKEEVEELVEEIPDNGRFKKTEVISPVYGRINLNKEIEYPKVEKFNRNQDDKEKKAEVIIEDVESIESIEEVKPLFEEVEEDEVAEELVAIEEAEEITAPVEEASEDKSFEKIDVNIMNSLMPKLDIKPSNDGDESGDVDSGVRATLGAFNDMLENVTIELAKKGKKKPEQIVDDISSDTEEIMALTATHNFSQDEEFLQALKKFKDSL